MEMEPLEPSRKGPAAPRPPQPDTETEITWVVWEARTNLLLGVATLLLIVALSLAIFWSLGSRFYGGLSLLVLLIAVLPFFLPTRYTLNEEGVQVRSILGNRGKPWRNLKVYFRDGERGVLLSPVTQYGLLARTRGIYLPYRGTVATAAQALVARHLAEGGRGK